MRYLTIEEIEKISDGCSIKVRKIAIENFLMSMGVEERVARANLGYDKSLYRWNQETVEAIKKGIDFACERKR